MAKKTIKTVVKTTEDTPLLKKEDIFILAKQQGYTGIESLYEIQGWFVTKYHLYSEIFYSMFHKKFSINNYFIDYSAGKKVEWDYKSTMYDTYNDALIVVLYNMLILTK